MIPEDVKERFVYFCEERENIRLMRLVTDTGPFTKDDILRDYRFCNINREHDAVTRWVAQCVRNKIEFESAQHLIGAMATCRVFNEPVTLEQMDFDVANSSFWFDVAAHRQSEGHKILRGAYMMPAHGNHGKGRGVVGYYGDAVEVILEDEEMHLCTTLEEVAEKLMAIRGLGSFLVNQICTDLRYTERFEDTPDWDTFVMCGPGSRRGIHRYRSMPLNPTKKQDYYQQAILEIREEVYVSKTLQEYFQDPNNLSNAFCEFDKYERARDAIINNTKPRLRTWKY